MTALEEKFTRMATGKPYNDLDPQLIAVRAEATRLTTALNQAPDIDTRLARFRDLVGSCGVDPMIEPNFRVEFGRNIHVKDHFYANYDCVLLDGAPITIGDRVLFGPKVGLYTSNHLLDPGEREAGGCTAQPITIGDQVWLAANVTVLPGVTIGANTVVGAGSVVTRDLPANVVAAGNPCRVLHPITAADKTGFTGVDMG
ncbi:sugar O-acetyltransferase [Schleiferilactobacillus harbinensis]|uniref:sugar O-acetyltransferase n=1 Tax=Schleiferilactobacillus harbinensis TaxID=304207 RepID=UPI001239F582|nr:sugar O-acetyltransferase [Schleiferilactobacillus harbinensis]QEU47368.1 sugar O-acetyltransferase [Schleiferilactobacillus harbinensis]